MYDVTDDVNEAVQLIYTTPDKYKVLVWNRLQIKKYFKVAFKKQK